MRKLVIIALICFTALSWKSGFAQGINFETTSLAAAMGKAGNPAEPKLILVDCYTTWCIPCLEMSQQEFPKKVAGDYFNPKFVSVKFDMEKGEGKEIGKKYNVTAYPTFLILNAQGQEINRVVGKATAEEFIEKVKSALDPKNSLAGLKAAYEESKNMQTGFPYALALYQNSKDPSPVLEELFNNAQDFERFSKDYLELAFGITKFGSPFFRKLMLEKSNIDAFWGTEVTNRIIFDKVRKDMYQIASETGARYNIFYTPKEVEEIAYTVALLKLRPDKPESHMCRIALYVINQDLDGLIAYYKRNIALIPNTDVFKGILDGILMKKMDKANEAQKTAIRAYFSGVAKIYEKEAQGYRNKAESLMKTAGK
ncbi:MULTISPECIES: thioredoxin family protein [unclassified Pedobacter]|uniref:thioredoxin family protein n=1 Tax=unclassified Pedobacter TaxID=2628915 RepID=UPI001423CE0B|nr:MULTISPECIES: thioredoxin family protein [unclassified Pedobacter]NII82044.1 thiol-disulfide isomerase/thioredoxin [Pedobacter sp. SG908]NMN36049.1 thiol-disulfide isomerase/thioredoxin [Pedobacter sp. SG918]